MSYGKSVIASLLLATAMVAAPAFLGCSKELGRSEQTADRHSDTSAMVDQQNVNLSAYQ